MRGGTLLGLALDGVDSWLREFFGVGLWQTIIGVFLGIPAALWLERRIEAQRRTEDIAELTRLLRDALERNAGLLRQLEGEFAKALASYLPFYSLDLSLLDATAHRKYELGLPPDTCRLVDTARYELRHLDDKLRLIRQSWDRAGPTSFTSMVQKSCVQHIPLVQKAVTDALQAVAA